MTIKDNVVEPKWEIQAPDRPYYLDIEGKRIWVSDEVYHSYKRSFWSEKKQQEEESRCVIGSDKTGIKKCRGNCGECTHSRNGKVLSLDRLYDDYAFEVAAEAPDILQSLIEKELYAKMWDEVDNLDEIDSQIMKLFSKGLSERAIAEKLGIDDSTVHKRKIKSFNILKEILKNYR